MVGWSTCASKCDQSDQRGFGARGASPGGPEGFGDPLAPLLASRRSSWYRFKACRSSSLGSSRYGMSVSVWPRRDQTCEVAREVGIEAREMRPEVGSVAPPLDTGTATPTATPRGTRARSASRRSRPDRPRDRSADCRQAALRAAGAWWVDLGARREASQWANTRNGPDSSRCAREPSMKNFRHVPPDVPRGAGPVHHSAAGLGRTPRPRKSARIRSSARSAPLTSLLRAFDDPAHQLRGMVGVGAGPTAVGRIRLIPGPHRSRS